jgi:hypothetical protein
MPLRARVSSSAATARLIAAVLFALGGALAIGACVKYEKSENPLGPTIAGPLPGVSISAPNPVQPGQNSRIQNDQQPVVLMVDNASTSGPRPLSYKFDVAVDGGFQGMVLTREGITPGNGRTSLRLPDALASGRTYFWRARAQDGANTGPYSPVASFLVFTPVVIGKPVAVAPGNSEVTTNPHPRFTIANASRSGPVGGITYTIEVSTSSGFSPLVAIWQIGEQPGQTNLNAPGDLAGGTRFYWHVRGADPSTLGPFSDTQTFKTPEAAPLPPSGGGAPCLTNTPEGVVQCRRSQYGARPSTAELVALLKGVAHDLNAMGYPGGPYGVLQKTSGANCNGYSCDIICAGQGPSQAQYDVLIDAGGTSAPTWNGPLTGITPRVCEIVP